MSPAVLPAPAWPGVLLRWELDPGVVAGVVLAGVAYEAGWRAWARSTGGRWAPRWRRWAFAAGLGIMVVALCSPVAVYSDELFSVHMVEHLLLVMGAAPLLVAGRPVAVTSGLLHPARRHRLLRLRRRRVVSVAGHPLVAWGAFAAVGWLVHFSGLYELSLEQPAAHAAEHVLLLGSALLFWRPIVSPGGAGRLSHPLRLLYLALAMPQETFLALALYSSSAPLYAVYGHAGRPWGPSPLADQRTAGGMLWVVSELALLVAVLVTANAWADHEARVTARREALEDAAAVAAERLG
ncbi:MAG: cytochrome c oxidase assembly protein [Acidimicrobiales bacterium]